MQTLTNPSAPTWTQKSQLPESPVNRTTGPPDLRFPQGPTHKTLFPGPPSLRGTRRIFGLSGVGVTDDLRGPSEKKRVSLLLGSTTGDRPGDPGLLQYSGLPRPTHSRPSRDRRRGSVTEGVASRHKSSTSGLRETVVPFVSPSL